MLINCSVPPLLQLTNHTSQQGNFLPRKLQKKWKALLSTYHPIKKTIYITKHRPNRTTHSIIEELHNYTYVHIPSLAIHDTNRQEWIKTLSNIAKTTNIQAHKITTQYTKNCIKKAISKYRQLYEKSQKINKKVFKNPNTPPID